MSNEQTFSEDELNKLLKLITSLNGINTYPNGDDNNKRIFAGCVELEKQGKLRRVIDEPDYVVFEASESTEVKTTIRRLHRNRNLGYRGNPRESWPGDTFVFVEVE